MASSSLAVNAGAAAKLQILLPGETATPGASPGKTGTPNTQTAGIAIANGIVVNAVDANWNVATLATPNVRITSSDATALIADDNGGAAGNITLAGGTGTLSSFTFRTRGAQTITASDMAGTLASNISATVTVIGLASTTTVASALNPSVFGQSVTFTGTVTGVAGTPTGTVTFKDGATTLGTGTLNGSGQATFATASLSGGTHAITAVYAGDGTYVGSTSTALTQTVNKADSTTALSSSADPICTGQPVTFTAIVNAVAPGAGTPTGTVTFKDGAATLGSSTLSTGQATFTTSSLASGNHTISATYNGSTNFNSSTSPLLAQSITGPNCSITGAGSLCANATGNTYTAPAAMSAYSWSISGNGTISGASSSQSVSVNAGGAGSFTLSVIIADASSCTSTCSTTVAVNSPPVITGNPANVIACASNLVSFTASASGSPTPGVQWQVSTDGGATFNNIAGATNATYTFTASLSDNGKRYRAVFANACGSAITTAATLTVTSALDATITADAAVCPNTTGNVASVPDAGAGATYVWSISGGTITGGAGTRSITYTAGASGSITLSVTVTTASGCSGSSSKSVTITSSPGRNTEAWRNTAPLQWQNSTFNTGDHHYGDGASIPFRLELTQLCPGASWCVVLQYDFKDGNTARHFYDFLDTYNASEPTVVGQECTNHTCSGTPTTFPIPTDTNLTYQLPSVFTVYNGTITNVSGYSTVNGSVIDK